MIINHCLNIGWRVDILSTVNTVWYSMNYCGYFFPNKPPLLNKGESGTSLFKLMRVHIKMINGWIIDTLYTTLRGFQGCLYFIVMIKPTLVASFCNTKPYILHLGITGSNKKKLLRQPCLNLNLKITQFFFLILLHVRVLIYNFVFNSRKHRSRPSNRNDLDIYIA